MENLAFLDIEFDNFESLKIISFSLIFGEKELYFYTKNLKNHFCSDFVFENVIPNLKEKNGFSVDDYNELIKILNISIREIYSKKYFLCIDSLHDVSCLFKNKILLEQDLTIFLFKNEDYIEKIEQLSFNHNALEDVKKIKMCYNSLNKKEFLTCKI